MHSIVNIVYEARVTHPTDPSRPSTLAASRSSSGRLTLSTNPAVPPPTALHAASTLPASQSTLPSAEPPVSRVFEIRNSTGLCQERSTPAKPTKEQVFTFKCMPHIMLLIAVQTGKNTIHDELEGNLSEE